jgi:hypothetical protein
MNFYIEIQKFSLNYKLYKSCLALLLVAKAGHFFGNSRGGNDKKAHEISFINLP